MMPLLPVVLVASLMATGAPESHERAADVEMPAYVTQMPSEALKTPLSADFELYVEDVALGYGLDPAVVYAVMWQESRFIPDAVGDSGRALGIMQVQPRWHEERMARLGVTDLLDEWQAVLVGCDYLSELLGEFGTYEAALTVYRYGCLTVTGEDYAGIVLNKANEYR